MSIETEPSAEDLLEPLEAYRKIYRDSFKTNCEKYYDGLVKASGVDAEANRLTVKSYNDHLAQLSAVEKLLAKNRGLKGFFIFLIVLGAILMIAGIFLLVGGSYAAGGGMLAVGAVFVVLFPIILAVKTISLLFSIP